MSLKYQFSLVSVVFLLGLNWSHLATAQQAEVYTVAAVSVDEVAETSEAAREQALQHGKVIAFQRLLSRIVPRSYESQFPQLNKSALDGLIRGIEVFDEKRSSVRYLAALKVTFKAKDVRSFLRKSGLPFSETRSKPLLVLPLMQYGYELILWGSPNPWRLAWQRREKADGLIPIIVPPGDLKDRQIIDVRTARRGVQQRLNFLRNRYNAGDIMVVEAKYSDDRPDALEIIIDYFGGAGTSSIVKNFDRPENIMDLADYLDQAVDLVHSELEDDWKGRTLIQLGTLSSMIVRIPVSSFPEWLAIRKRLAGISVMDRVTVTSLTSLEGRVALNFYGDSNQLVVALAQEDLILDRSSGMWTVQLRQ